MEPTTATRARTILRHVLPWLAALACAACAPASVREPALRMAHVVDAMPGLSFREALLSDGPFDSRPGDASRRAAVWAVAMDMQVEDDTLTVAVFPDRSSAYAGDTWEQAYVTAGLPMLEAYSADVIRYARSHPERFDQDCARTPPPTGMARVWMRTSGGLRCLPPVPIEAIAYQGKFDIYCVMISVFNVLVAEPEI